MKKITLSALFVFAIGANLFGQSYTPENKVWDFGNHAGLDFTSGTPVPVTASINILEGCGSVSDASGHLLFYTDGKVVWDKTGTPMPHGGSIVTFLTGDASQGAEIVPVIDNPNQYYVFSSDVYSLGDLAVSVVDMTLNGGLGDVITPSGTSLGNNYAEKMTSIAGNSCDVWLLTRRRDSTQFWAFHATAAGLSGPVISNVGTIVHYNAGVIKASPNRLKVAAQICESAAGTELFDFDPNTGIVSNCQVLDLVGNNYGAEFSPDNTKLYGSQLFGTEVYQYDVSLPTTAAIIASKTLIGTSSELGDFKLGPDGKIYLVKYGVGYLDVIPNPNVAGIGCGYTINATALGAGATGQLGLPNLFNAVGTIGATYVHHDTGLCIPAGGSATIYAYDIASAYHWNDGDTNSYHTITAPGNYWVQEGNGCTPIIDSITVIVRHDTVHTHTDTTVCSPDDNFKCDLTAPLGTDYIWYDGTTGAHNLVNANGSYWVGYLVECTFTVDTFHVTFQYNPPAIVGPDSICLGNSAKLTNAMPGGTWSSSAATIAPIGSTTGVVSGASPGTSTIKYTLATTGCFASRTETVLAPPCVSGVRETPAASTEVELFPNPATEECTISYAGGMYAGASIMIYDVTGRLIHTYPLSGSHTSISVSDLKPGLYDCRIDVDGKGIISKKLTVMK